MAPILFHALALGLHFYGILWQYCGIGIKQANQGNGFWFDRWLARTLMILFEAT